MSPSRHFYTAWTIRVDIVELGARHDALRDSKTERESLQRCSQDPSSRLSGIPQEIVEMIGDAVENSIYLARHQVWSTRVQCLGGCDTYAHLQAAEAKIKADLDTARARNVVGPELDGFDYAADEIDEVYAAICKSRHKDNLNALLQEVKTLPNSSEMLRFVQRFGLKPLFLHSVDEIAYDSMKVMPHNIHAKDTLKVEAHLALPVTEPQTTKFGCDHQSLWSEKIYNVVNRAEPALISQDPEVSATFRRALTALNLTALADDGGTISNESVTLLPSLRGIGTLTPSGWGALKRYGREISWVKKHKRISYLGYH